MAAMTVEQRFDLVLSAQQFMQLDSGLCFSARDFPYEQGMYKHPNIRVCARRCSAVRTRIMLPLWKRTAALCTAPLWCVLLSSAHGCGAIAETCCHAFSQDGLY